MNKAGRSGIAKAARVKIFGYRSIMETLRWIGTAIVAASFVGLSIYNWRFFLHKIRRGDTRMSPVPWVAGAAGMLALWLCPLDSAFTWWWVPFVIDFGSIPNSLWVGFSAASSKI